MSLDPPSRLAARLAAACVLASLCACALARPAKPAGPILFLSDFGTKDGAVAACKGVMWSIAPRAAVVDLTHEVPPYDIAAAGELLEQAAPYYPPGTIVVAVVDPGVGGPRRGLAARTRAGHLLVGPDNGVFTRLLDREGLALAVELKEARYFRASDPSSTFHGRDVFAPVAAHLARGERLEALGPPMEPERLKIPVAERRGERLLGEVRYVEDPYGNVVTNIPLALLDALGAKVGDELEVEIGGKSRLLPYRKTFGEVPAGAELALIHSRGVLSFSINKGDFAARYGVKRGYTVRVRLVSR